MAGGVIVADGLVKRFPRALAVDRVSFEVAAGEIYGLLGPNGAGKTTTVRMLAGLLRPTRGRAVVDGFDAVREAHQVRGRIGILTEVPGLYERLTPLEYLDFFAQAQGLRGARRWARLEELLLLVGLWDQRHRVMRAFSKGTQQRVAIARTLLHDPPVLFFDEPTAALDPEAAKSVRDYLAQVVADRGKAVLLCTHNLPEAERLCRRLSVLSGGRQVAEGTPEALKFGVTRPMQLRLREVDDALMGVVSAVPGVSAVSRSDHTIVFETGDPARVNPRVVSRLVGLGAEVITLEEQPVTLEDVYLGLMRRHGPEP
jgi:ABC-2 type transport system ATP-binding protein